jgi:hypothetical protein
MSKLALRFEYINPSQIFFLPEKSDMTVDTEIDDVENGPVLNGHVELHPIRAREASVNQCII